MYKIKRGNRFLLIILLCNIIGGILLGTLAAFSSLLRNLLLSTDSLSTLIMLAITQVCFLGIPTGIFLMIRKKNIKDIIRLNPITNKDAISTFFIALLLTPVLMLLSAITNIFSENSVSQVVGQISTMPLYIMLIGVAILPSIFEEFVMRGVILSEYRNTSVRKAIFMNGLLFCMFHLNIQQSLYTFAMGSLMAFFVIYTGSIIPSMIFHFTVNGFNVLLSKIAVDSSNTIESSAVAAVEPTNMQMIISYGSLAIVAVACTLKAIDMIRKFAKRNEEEMKLRGEYIGEKEKVIDVYLVIGILVYIIYTVIITRQIL